MVVLEENHKHNRIVWSLNSSFDNHMNLNHF